MRLSSNPLSQAIRTGLTVGLVGLVGTTGAVSSAYAQDDADTRTLERIEVLGSRIKRADAETSVPVLSIDRQDIERTGLTQLADVIKELSVNGPTLGLQTNNGNTSGYSYVNLRNCGSNRTLVLVNGRRWVSSGALGGSVDLSSIPLAAVERIEVLKDGASALYGTDAICGVVNIQTRTNFEGASARAYVGQYDDDDGLRQSYDFTIGAAGERWSTMMNVSFAKQDPVSAGARDISAVPLFGFPATVSSPGRASPTGPYGNFPGLIGGTTGILDPTRTGCRPNEVCTATGDFRAFNFLTDGYNFAPDNHLIQPQQQHGLFVQGHLDITDSIRFRSEVFYNHRNSNAQLAAQPLSPITINANSVYNPFGQTITGAGFRPTDFPRIFGAEVDTWRFGGGFEGAFQLADRYFDWDVGYNYATTKMLNPKNGFYFSTRVAQATGPSFIDANGVAQCGTPAAPIAGCVPLNIMGGPQGFTREMFNYIAVDPKNVADAKSVGYTANLAGELFNLPGGTAAFAAGYEYRRESGGSFPDPLTAAGLVLGDNPFLPTEGSYNVDEFYLELQLPLLSDVFLARALELSLAARYSDYSSFGDTTNPKASIRWQPFDDLLVRGSWGKGFRAPSIGELFAGVGSGRPAGQDPCSATSAVYQQNQSVRTACASAGVPAGYVQSSAQLRGSSGGNVNLQPELATTKTLGLVYSPSYAEGLDLYVDWYNIRLYNNISAYGIGTILNNCYVFGITDFCQFIQRDLDGSVYGNPGEIHDILAYNQNFQSGLENEGWDFGLAYRFDTDFGGFLIRWDNTYTSYYGDLDKPERGERNRDGNPSGGNLIGGVPAGSSQGAARWRLRSNLSTTWNLADWSVTASAEYHSKVQESCTNVNNTANALGNVDPAFRELRNLCSDPNRIINGYFLVPGGAIEARPIGSPVNELDKVVYIDLQASWNSPWNGRISGGVRNLFDEEPPYASDAFANTFDAQYRIPGRFYYLSYEQRF